jgi:uncharacterized repeat protein (TIGR03803 family)
MKRFIHLSMVICSFGVGHLRAQYFTVLRNFDLQYLQSAGAPTTNTDGAVPLAALVLGHDGKLYGSASAGGAHGQGTLFSLNRDGSGFAKLHTFSSVIASTNSDGGQPRCLFQGNDGNLYGTTYSAGRYGYGNLYRINTNGTGFLVLYDFADTADGKNPSCLIQSSDGKLYGTAGGGTNGAGVIFTLLSNGSGFRVLHTFAVQHLVGGAPVNADGAGPCSLIQGIDGVLYGRAAVAGPCANGSVFRLNTSGDGFTNLYQFCGMASGSLGTQPVSLLQARDGALYSTFWYPSAAFYWGMVFTVRTNGADFAILHNFSMPNLFGKVDNFDGAEPLAGLLQGRDGKLYGPTQIGGTNGWGTLFAMTTSGTPFQVLHNFVPNDGNGTLGALIEGPDGILFGSASSKGAYDSGTLFALAVPQAPPPPKLEIAKSGTNVLLSWPGWATNFFPEKSGTISNIAVWAPLNGGILVGTNFVATNAIATSNVFFRLRAH